MSKDEARSKIQKLVDKYETIKASNSISKYNEEETKKGFIEPLFESLGWDISDKSEVTLEEHQSSGRVDYGFYLVERLKFYLEAKSLKSDLNKETFADQAIKYSWNKGATWAILTDFESIKVFNAQDIDRSLADKLFFEIPYTQFLERFDQLWWLSKDSFIENVLDKEAEKVGKKFQRVSVSSLLYKDLNKCRELLTDKLSQMNKDVDRELLDEGVQKLLDRLIFLRVAEDRGVEQPVLVPLIRDWENKGGKLYESMIKKFREYDEVYNSNLFSPHPFEEWEEYSGVTEDVIKILYGKPGYYEYDFKAMPADVLGTVYENYLGYKLEKSKKGLSLSKDSKKRKEHGIYYTPSFIVDYIVKNTLKPVLGKCNSIEDLKKIKVLDPACGSGSFLIKALEVIYNKYLEFGNSGGVFTKLDILLNNIYGVDLDQQAVEIARLNLLISALDVRMKLPGLERNIKRGNSLISDSSYSPDAFNWEEQFPEVFKQGGFNVIIGNPPYGAELSEKDQKYLSEIYKIGSTDTAILFIKKATDLLSEKGNLGFIVPKAFSFASNYKKIRDLLYDDLKILVDCGKVWNSVKLEQIIFILENNSGITKYQTGLHKDGVIKIIGNIDKTLGKTFGFLLNGVSDSEISIAQRILDTSIFLNKISKNNRGLIINKFIDSGKYPVIGGKEIGRFGVKRIRGNIDQDLKGTKSEIQKNSVLVQGIVAHIENPIDHIKIIACVADERNYFIADNINQLIVDLKFSPYFVWSILNSKLINWYCYRFIYGKSIRTMRFDNPVTSRIPITKANKDQQEKIVELSKKLLDMAKTKNKTRENTNEWDELKEEIGRMEKKIDEEVYKLYGLTSEEIETVENS